MQRLDNMINTERLAIKTSDGKVIIEKKNINDKNMYLVTLPINFLFKTIRFDSNNLMIVLNKMDLYEDITQLHTTVYSNMAVRTEYIIDQTGYLHRFSNMYVPEPEEESKMVGMTFGINSLKSIVTDPDMFIEMMDNKMIKADDEALIKFDLYTPKIRIIEGGKSKTKKKK